jgi:hypothetical protein
MCDKLYPESHILDFGDSCPIYVCRWCDHERLKEELEESLNWIKKNTSTIYTGEL